jgi:hypothetical protein
MSKGLTFSIICAVVIASSIPARGQQSNQTDSAFIKQRAGEKAKVKKVDALTWKMKVQESKKGAGLKAKDGGKSQSDQRGWKSRAGHRLTFD